MGFYVFIVMVFFSTFAYAAPDGLGNEVFPASNVGIGTMTPQAALVVSNGNVGIGTWTAGSLLTVNGTLTSSALAGDGSQLTSVVTAFTDSGSQVLAMDIADNVGIGTNSAANGKLMVYGGNVGIGTVNQTTAAMLHISTKAAQDLLRIDDNGDGDATPFIIDSTGNVGIGTATAQTNLTVMGPVGIGTWTTSTETALSVMAGNVGIATTTPQTNLAIIGSVGIGTWTTEAGTALSVMNGNVGVGTATAQTLLTVMNGNVGIGTWTAAGGNLIINGGGNMGIGTSWPGQKLDVQGTVGATAFVGGGGSLTGFGGFTDAGTQILTTILTDNVGIGTSGASTGKLMVYGANVGIGTVNQTTAAMLHISTQAVQDLFRVDDDGDGDTSPFVIASSGNVGISTWSPMAPLDISEGNNVALLLGADTGLLSRTDNTDKTALVGANHYSASEEPVAVLMATSTATDNTLFLGGGSALENAATDIWTFTAANSTTLTGTMRMAVNSQGNVGIGTTTPQGGMGVTNGNMGIGTWTADGGRLIVMGGGHVGIGTAFPDAEVDVTGTARATSITALSNVGIGTSTPEVNLAVLGPVGIGTWTSAAGTGLAIRNGNVGLGTHFPQTNFVVLGAVGIGTWTTDEGTALSVMNGNVGFGTFTPQVALVITNGNMGIGTWTAQSLLQVKGSLGTTVLNTTGDYTAGVNDYAIFVDASLGAVTIGLPAASGVAGRIYVVRKIDNSANSVIIDPNGAETIDGAGTFSTTSQHQSYTVVSDGSNWYAI